MRLIVAVHMRNLSSEAVIQEIDELVHVQVQRDGFLKHGGRTCDASQRVLS